MLDTFHRFIYFVIIYNCNIPFVPCKMLSKDTSLEVCSGDERNTYVPLGNLGLLPLLISASFSGDQMHCEEFSRFVSTFGQFFTAW